MHLEVSTSISAPVEDVWAVISQVGREPEFWHGTRSVKEVKREGSTIWREKIQMFRNSLEREKVTLYPDQRKIVYEEIEGFMRGTKIDSLSPEGATSTRFTTVWEISPSGFLKLGSPFIKRHIANGTISAHGRIKETVEKTLMQRTGK